jgi:FKBP-type peptidyl-prolyl cis-trans isomerase FklB
MRIAAISVACLGLVSAYAHAANETFSTTPVGNTTEMRTSLPETNKAKGESFLAENMKKHDIITLPDGLQYKVITEGKGASPTNKDIVSVHYVGTLIDGKEFDSSYKRNQPASFPVDGVIPGWTEALQLMKVGSTWELFIPANLAYGEEGAPPTIGPNETLIFKVTLLDIKK